MCGAVELGSMEFRPTIDKHLQKVKLYVTVVHAIQSLVPRPCPDDMPITMFTMLIRVGQLQALSTL